MTGYLFYLIALVDFFIRLINHEFSFKTKTLIRQSLLFWSPVILAGLVFLIQLMWLDALPKLISRALYRSGKTGGVDFLVKRFWNYNLPISFGQIGRVIILLSIILLVAILACAAINRIRKKPSGDISVNRLISIASLALFPPVLHVLVLKNYNAFHLFCSLKFAVPLSLIPFIIFPVLVLLTFKLFFKDHHKRQLKACISKDQSLSGLSIVIAVFLLLLAAGYAAMEKNRMSVFFTSDSTAAASARHESIYRFIGKHTGYEDVVFSPFLEVRSKNKVPLILTGKNIYRLFSIHDIYYMVRHIRSAFNVCIVIDSRQKIPSWIWSVARGEAVAEDGGWLLYRVDGQQFLEFYRRESTADTDNVYFSEKRECERLRNEISALLSRNDFEGVLTRLRNILAFLEKYNAVIYNTRYLIMEMAILNILNREGEASEMLARLSSMKVLPAMHPIWGWDPEPATLGVIRRDPVSWRILVGGL